MGKAGFREFINKSKLKTIDPTTLFMYFWAQIKNDVWHF